MDTRKFSVRAGCGALLALALLAPAAAPALAKAPGSLWTTNAGCAATNVNKYATGDWVYLRGAGFAANTSFHWSIAGLPGGASAASGAEVMSGNKITDTAGSFCFAAYQVKAGDRGEYKATVTVAAETKADNYRANGASTDGQSGGTVGSTGGTGGSTGGTGGSTGATGDSTGTNGTGGSTGGSNDSNTTATGSSPIGSTGGTGGSPSQAVEGATSQGPTGTTGGTQIVLGATSTHTNGTLPSTDTVAPTSNGDLGFLVLGFAALAAAAALATPSRRRSKSEA